LFQVLLARASRFSKSFTPFQFIFRRFQHIFRISFRRSFARQLARLLCPRSQLRAALASEL
jgi:hypothetical protein